MNEATAARLEQIIELSWRSDSHAMSRIRELATRALAEEQHPVENPTAEERDALAAQLATAKREAVEMFYAAVMAQAEKHSNDHDYHSFVVDALEDQIALVRQPPQ